MNLNNEKGYTGQKHFVSAPAVNDNGFITANETSAIDLVYEIMRTLKIGTNEEIDVWHDNFKNGMLR